jgi:hypothetical protein
MKDITPSPAADGPFSLVTDTNQVDLIARARKLSNPRLAKLVSQGKSFDDITRILYKEEAALASAAGSSHHV